MNISKLIFILAYLLFLNISNSFAQQKEFGFISDNDLYVSLTSDKYYTNGLELYYQFSTETQFLTFSKRIKTFRVGQKMYNPFDPDVPFVRFQDRPYAGHIYSNYTETFSNKKHIVSLGVEIGITGKDSKAREAQNFIHKFYSIAESDGWDAQISTKRAFGINAAYTRNLFYQEEAHTQLAWINKTTLNSITSTISSGLAIKFNMENDNPFTGIHNSSFYNTSLATKNLPWLKECFFGIKSTIDYQFKDYTVTGKLYGSRQKLFQINPWVWKNDFGFYWNLEHWNVSYHQIFHTSNVKNINANWIRYGTISISYKL